MSKSTEPITYTYRVETPTETKYLLLTRRHTGTAYARNGNVGNPTEYFMWDTVIVTGIKGRYWGRYTSRAEAYEYGRAAALGIRYVAAANRPGMRAGVNVRHYIEVQREMKENYVSMERDAWIRTG